MVPIQFPLDMQPEDLDLRNLGDVDDVQMGQINEAFRIPRPTSALSEAFSEASNLGHATARMTLLDGTPQYTATGLQSSNSVAVPQPVVPGTATPTVVRSDSFSSISSA